MTFLHKNVSLHLTDQRETITGSHPEVVLQTHPPSSLCKNKFTLSRERRKQRLFSLACVALPTCLFLELCIFLIYFAEL